MRAKVIAFMLIGLLFGSLMVITNSGDGISILKDEFGNTGTPTERLITLTGKTGPESGEHGAPYKDATSYLDLPMGKNVILPDSYLKISPVDNGDGLFAVNPSVDIGMDGDLEWAFQGTGYGEFGYQNIFNNGESKRTLKFSSTGGSNTNLKVKIPKNANVVNASFNIEGRLSAPSFTKYQLDIDKGLLNPRTVAVGDISGDGVPDIVATSSNSNTDPDVVWYENSNPPGSGEWIKRYISNSTRYAWGVKIADLDNDGDNDVIVSSTGSDGVIWFENTGTGTSWETVTSGHRIDNNNKITSARNIDIGDIDNDGDIDVAVSPLDWSNSNVYWFENTDPVNGTSWTRYLAYNGGGGGQVNDIRVVKINRTGSPRLDIVIANWQSPNYDLYWLENDGTPTSGAWKYHRINPISSTYNSPLWIDAGFIDGDSYIDVAAAHDGTRGTYWYKGPSDPTNTTLSWTAYRVGNTYYPSMLKIGKIDSDGDMDILTSTSSTVYGFNIQYFENPGTTSTWANTNVDTSLLSLGGLAIIDFNSDSNNDIVAVGMSAGEIKWYENPGGTSPTFTDRYVDEAGVNQPRGLYVADIDKDNDNDFIVTGMGGSEVLWYENPSDPTDTSAWVSHTIGTGIVNPRDVAVGDFNKDTYPDVAVTSFQYNTGIYWFENPGSNVKSVSSWTKRRAGPSIHRTNNIAVGDVDGDGDADIVASQEYWPYDIIYFDNNNGAGTSWITRTIASGISYYPTGVALGDLNNDGILDATVGPRWKWTWGAGTSVIGIIAPSNPASGTWKKIDIDTDFFYIYDTFIMDIDRDGYNDVVAASSSDGINWYQNPGSAGTTWKEFNIYTDSSFGESYIWAGDIGNDGYYDIIASSLSKNKVYWFEQPDNPEKGGSWESYVVGSMTNPRGVFVSQVDQDSDDMLDIIAVGQTNSEVAWYSAKMTYPWNIDLNVGGLGPVDFTYADEVKAPKRTTNLATQFNELLGDISTYWETDDYGNNLTDIFLEVSAPNASRVMIHSVNITYIYDAKIEFNPHNEFLFNELNEIVPDEGDGNYSVYILVQSYTPATLKLSGVNIRYNNPPTLDPIIPSDRHVLEGTSNSHLVDLHDHFTDDHDRKEDLIYKVEYNSRSDKIWALISHSRYLKISATKDMDWFGEVELMISATDSLGMKTYSNKFNVTIDNNDDPPYLGIELPDFEIPEGQTTFLADLNNTDYFLDFDSTELFYRGVVDDSYRNYLRIDFDRDNNMYATAEGDWYENKVPVQIYADDEDLSDKTYDELENMEVFQDISIDVININDAPIWVNFPDEISVEEDYTITHTKDFKWINLNDFVRDIDNTEFDHSFSIVKNSNSSFINVYVDKQDYVHVDNSLVENFNGLTQVTVRVSDGAGYSDIMFYVKIIPLNDPPSITILSPGDRSTVYGTIAILGQAYDLEGLEKVMVQINDKPATKATGTTNWKFTWNTLNYNDGDYTLKFWAFDNDEFDQKVSKSVSLNLKVYNALTDPDGDGYSGEDDAFPNEPTQWSDADDDGYGDNPFGFDADQFPEDHSEWIDTDGDGYGNNKDDFPYDKTQWNDTDKDGYGDNPWGNNPDTNINNPSVPGNVETESQEKEVSEKNSAVTYLWYIVYILLVIIIIISVVFYVVYNPGGKE